ITREENDLLTRVEGQAPMGQLMRRHWLPVCLVEEVSEPDCDPVRARVLGERLVVFRDSYGNVGVLDERCPHRSASLALGRNEEGGLRCLYHGWKMDVHGNLMELASEPNDERMRNNIKQTAYPVKEWGGMIWAYLGPKETMPEFTPPAWAPTPDVRVSI